MKEKSLTISLPLQISELATGLIFAGATTLSFFVPFALGHPQWLVGTAVNACLFLAAIFLPKKYYIPLIILPSLGVLARGMLLGPLTMFLVYFLPLIWLGNLILILNFKSCFKSLKFVFSVFIGAGAKYLFLFITADIYFKFHFVPKVFLQIMGLNQLATALAGGLVALIIFKIYEQLNAGSKKAA